MFGVIGYNFVNDINSLDPKPTSVNDIKTVKVQNGVYDRFYMTRDVSYTYNNDFPISWDFDTIMDADFNGNIDAGNIDFALSTVSTILIKRRLVGTFDWITLYEISVDDIESSNYKFSVNDIFNKNGAEYEYAFVPTTNGNEGDYIANTIVSEFSGIFICDPDTLYRFYLGTQYSGFSRKIQAQVYEPIGSKYPVVVSNSATNYESGILKGDILTKEDVENGMLNREEEVKIRKAVTDFVTNKKPKIIKDWNGNIWLVMVSSSPTLSFYEKLGMGFASTSIEWVEIGDAESGKDLYDSGILKIPQGG